jgi:replicative DNA helicase
MKDPGVYYGNRSVITPALFAEPINRRIAKEIGRLADRDRPFGIADLARVVATDDGTEASGYLSSLIFREADVETATDRIADLRDAWACRMMAHLGAELIQQASEDSDRPAIERLEKALERGRSIGEALDDVDTSARSKTVERVLARVAENVKRGRSDGIPWFLREIATTARSEIEHGWFCGLIADSAGGKTSLALQQAVFTAQQGTPVLFLTGDQTVDDCYIQMASQILGLEFEVFLKGRLNVGEHQSFVRLMGQLRELPIHFIEIDSPRVIQIGRWVQDFVRKFGRGLVIIDHDDIIEADNKRDQLHDRVKQTDRDLKALMRRFRCGCLYLMQRNAEGENRDVARPVDKDLVGGPRRRKSFDLLLFLYREAMWHLKRARIEKNPNTRAELMSKADIRANDAEIGVMKNRHARPDQSCMVKWEGAYSRFRSVEQVKADEKPELFDDD